MENFKIAFTGSSGAGKTTLVLWLVALLQELDPEYKHISGSAGAVKTEGDKMLIDDVFKYPGGSHAGVIRYSALNPEYGLMNQKLLQLRRNEIIFTNNKFVTDRSPVDNLTYMINQTAYHPMVTDELVAEFAKDSLKGFEGLTHLIYVKACQPKEVENNGNRISNWWYQQAVDAQFEKWLRYLDANTLGGPEILVLDFWDLEKRKEAIKEFLGVNYIMDIAKPKGCILRSEEDEENDPEDDDDDDDQGFHDLHEAFMDDDDEDEDEDENFYQNKADTSQAPEDLEEDVEEFLPKKPAIIRRKTL